MEKSPSTNAFNFASCFQRNEAKLKLKRAGGRGTMTKTELTRMFIHEALRPEQIDLLKEFGQMFLNLAGCIVVNTTECAETTIALRKLQESQQYLYLAVLKTEIAPEQANEVRNQNG
jgi:hypothetical protein